MRRAAAALAVALLAVLMATGPGTPTPSGAQTTVAQSDTEESGPRPL